eukprot:TRINITY_DN2761_c0_g1_i16.p1 TRINITY_DN2761_c0_g1~~TRINITY_DN2761_c0_g1_i16.p1  ORF type:complete len:172 (-),score=21.43 TRINITY_DN2761_c0_g1_i16:174-689(-)
MQGPSLCREPVGTPHFMAPEMIRGEMCDEKIDVWAVGVVVYTMLCGQLPFEDTNQNCQLQNWAPLYQKICETRPSFAEDSWATVGSSALQQLIEVMMTPRVSERPGFQQLLGHEWLLRTSTNFVPKRSEPVLLDEPKNGIRGFNSWWRENHKQEEAGEVAYGADGASSACE